MADRAEGGPRPRLAVQVVPVEQVQYLVDELVLCPRRTGTVIEGHRDGHPVCRQVPHKSVLGLQAAGGPHGPMVTLDDEPALLAGTGAGHRNDGRGGERPWAVPGDTGGGSALLQAGHAPQELAHLLGPQWRPVGEGRGPAPCHGLQGRAQVPARSRAGPGSGEGGKDEPVTTSRRLANRAAQKASWAARSPRAGASP